MGGADLLLREEGPIERVMDTQTYEERQEDELEFLHCVFMNDFEDLRKKDSWKVGHNMSIQFRPSIIKNNK